MRIARCLERFHIFSNGNIPEWTNDRTHDGWSMNPQYPEETDQEDSQ